VTRRKTAVSMLSSRNTTQYLSFRPSNRWNEMFVLRLSPKHVKAPGRSPRSGNVARTRRNTVKVLNTGSWSNLELLAIACAAWMEGSENPSFSATRQVTLLYCIQTVTMYARRSSSCCFGVQLHRPTGGTDLRLACGRSMLHPIWSSAPARGSYINRFHRGIIILGIEGIIS